MLLHVLNNGFMSRTRVAVLTATIIRGQTYLKVLRKGIAFSLHIILKKNVCVLSPNLEIGLKEGVASPVQSFNRKSEIVPPFTSSLVSTAHPPRTRCREWRYDLNVYVTRSSLIVGRACGALLESDFQKCKRKNA